MLRTGLTFALSSTSAATNATSSS